MRGLRRRSWAHPRRCEADIRDEFTLARRDGSSPQVRGRLHTVAQVVGGVGLIPAGAGQTRSAVLSRGRSAAHPRRCGADGLLVLDEEVEPGSSPQVRGRRASSFDVPRCAGLIPAGARQTRRWVINCGFCWAHPRRCGADELRGVPLVVMRGSSPQVRGRQRPRLRGHQSPGLIPTGAGQTSSPRPPAPSHRAHPRRCGADYKVTLSSGEQVGSSPQVRGRLLPVQFQFCLCGLIPAGAGQTGSITRTTGPYRAHPRRCGADLFPTAVNSSAWGSSPQVRGRRQRAANCARAQGLIPAGAGQT